MKKQNKLRPVLHVCAALLLSASLSLCFGRTAFAITEAEVQAQVSAQGKESVSGNVLIWFLCAIAFLKVSQKIDSFMSSLGINVGHTGGSMLAEAMIAARGVGAVRNFSRGSVHMSGGSAGSAATAGAGMMKGGLAGIVSRQVTNNAVKSATSQGQGKSGQKAPGGLGGRIYSSSVSHGGSFANKVISTVAQGSISTIGSMTGEKAAKALSSYLGYAALGEGAANVPSFSNVEIGGGRITGTETSPSCPEGIAFGMYDAAQYTAPDGNYTTVQAADGSSWYKQYATDTVDRTPYMAPDGEVAYHESIVKKLPPAPRRKDRM